MKNNINISGNNQVFTYSIEYINGTSIGNISSMHNIHWYQNINDENHIYLLEKDVEYYRDRNDWYSIENIDDKNLKSDHIPEDVEISTIRIYLPSHSISSYSNNVKYIVSVNTWIHGHKIDLGSFMFRPTDTSANDFGILKDGNNEYSEHIDFDIIDPFYLTYSDKWIDFRNIICDEPKNLNTTGSQLFISLYAVVENNNRYIMNDEYVGGMTCFNISNESDFLKLNLDIINKNDGFDPGLKLTINMNKEYDWLLNYLFETYNINVSHNDINFELVIKDKDSIIPGPKISYGAKEDFGKVIQYVYLKNLMKNDSFKTFFSDWNTYEEGWTLMASMIITDEKEDEETFNIISNEVPITQEIFSMFINNCSEKIIEDDDMNIIQYNVVNKIENNIVQLERPNESKANIMQPVFFKVKDTEMLTIHPMVTENICINLDDYKSKVERFVLQIGNCKFKQIGANNYGIIFKITGNTISDDIISGTYYILNENQELVTTGKYNCIR